MIKARWRGRAATGSAARAALREAFADMTLDQTDGLHFSRDEEWVHVRASGTEPVVRVIAESPGRACHAVAGGARGPRPGRLGLARGAQRVRNRRIRRAP